MPRQIGSIAKYVEPVNISNSLDYQLELFKQDPKLTAIPIEQNDRVIGLVERHKVNKLLSNKLLVFSTKKIEDFVQSFSCTVFAREYIEKNLTRISNSIYAEDVRFFPGMFTNNSFYGIVSFEDYLARLSEIREQDMEKARVIQQHMLPKTDLLKNLPFSLGIWNCMANAVGGDYYVSKKLSQTKYVVASFDVSGKNVAAALLTVAVGSFFASRIAISPEIPTPASMTVDLDEFLTNIVPVGNFITGALCYIDMESKTIEIHNCGHTPIYAFVPDHESKKIKISTIQPNLPPFGMGSVKKELSSIDKGNTVPVAQGVHINLYSDGFTDMQNESGHRYDDEKTKQFFMKLYRTHASEMEALTQKTVSEWIENAMIPDDITVMALRF